MHLSWTFSLILCMQQFKDLLSCRYNCQLRRTCKVFGHLPPSKGVACRLAETPECWCLEFQLDASYADNFGYIWRIITYICRQITYICRQSRIFAGKLRIFADKAVYLQANHVYLLANHVYLQTNHEHLQTNHVYLQTNHVFLQTILSYDQSLMKNGI